MFWNAFLRTAFTHSVWGVLEGSWMPPVEWAMTIRAEQPGIEPHQHQCDGPITALRQQRTSERPAEVQRWNLSLTGMIENQLLSKFTCRENIRRLCGIAPHRHSKRLFPMQSADQRIWEHLGVHSLLSLLLHAFFSPSRSAAMMDYRCPDGDTAWVAETRSASEK